MTQRGGLQCKAARNGVWVPRATSRRGEGGATQPGLDAPPTSHAPSRRWLYSPGAGARRGTAGARWSGAARPESGGPGRRPERGTAGARRPGAARPERCGPGRRPERGGPARRPGAAPTALSAGLLAARWVARPRLPWPLAAAKLGLAAAREENRGEREAERDEWWGLGNESI